MIETEKAGKIELYNEAGFPPHWDIGHPEKFRDIHNNVWEWVWGRFAFRLVRTRSP